MLWLCYLFSLLALGRQRLFFSTAVTTEPLAYFPSLRYYNSMATLQRELPRPRPPPREFLRRQDRESFFDEGETFYGGEFLLRRQELLPRRRELLLRR